MNKFSDGQSFFQSWKAGVKLAVPEWFGDGNNPATAETKGT
jgi:hypothetical protein